MMQSRDTVSKMHETAAVVTQQTMLQKTFLNKEKEYTLK